MQTKILNFGSLNLDYAYSVPHFVRPGETLAAERLTVNYGGKGFNQSIALARAGARVWHAGCVGKGGEPLRAYLGENGVGTSFLEDVEEMQGNAVIEVNGAGENCIMLYGGSNRAISDRQIMQTIEQFSKGDCLVLQNEISGIFTLVERGYEAGMKIVLNPSPFEAALLELDYGKISWLLVNEVEAEQMVGFCDPEKIRAAFREKYPALNIVLTLGGRGAFCYAGDEEIFQPVYPAKAVDTTGAGDTFTGYFLEALARGCPLRECMRRAACAAAICVERNGAAKAVPTRAEVEKRLEEAGR